MRVPIEVYYHDMIAAVGEEHFGPYFIVTDLSFDPFFFEIINEQDP